MPKGLGYAFAIPFLSPSLAPELIALCAPIVSTLGAAPLLVPEGSAPKFSIAALIKVGTDVPVMKLRNPITIPG